MTNHEFSNPDLPRLASLQMALEENGGPFHDGQLFEQILELQDEILKSYGLPSTPDNVQLLWFKAEPTASEINKRLKSLQDAATAYLLSNAQSELQTLRDAQKMQQDAFYVLPELKIKTHIYTLFVYDKILLKQKDSIQNILYELKFVSNDPEILDTLGRLAQGLLDNEHEVTASLAIRGVRYIQQFIMHNSNLLSDDDY